MKIFLIAEIGINHNGDIKIAKKLIDYSSEAGFDAVKFQKRNVEKVYSKDYLDGFRESPWGTTQRDQKMGLEFDRKEYEEIDNEFINNSEELKKIMFNPIWEAIEAGKVHMKAQIKWNKKKILSAELEDILKHPEKRRFPAQGTILRVL